MTSSDAGALTALFCDDIHEDQRLAILAATVVATCSAQPPDRRFRFIVGNLDAMVREVRDGYRLFASEFTYAKIRRDVETAQFDYLGKIHKTFTDIQGQLLGIPVATIVVASQLKVVSACGLDFWTDEAVVCGAWVFVLLVAVAIANQWLTLDAVRDEVEHQKQRLDGDYAPIADKFADVFTTLNDRLRLHRWGLLAVAAVALGGASLATIAARRVIDVNVGTCLSGRPAVTTSSTPSTVTAPPSTAAASRKPIAPIQPPSKAPKGP